MRFFDEHPMVRLFQGTVGGFLIAYALGKLSELILSISFLKLWLITGILIIGIPVLYSLSAKLKKGPMKKSFTQMICSFLDLCSKWAEKKKNSMMKSVEVEKLQKVQETAQQDHEKQSISEIIQEAQEELNQIDEPEEAIDFEDDEEFSD